MQTSPRSPKTPPRKTSVRATRCSLPSSPAAGPPSHIVCPPRGPVAGCLGRSRKRQPRRTPSPEPPHAAKVPQDGPLPTSGRPCAAKARSRPPVRRTQVRQRLSNHNPTFLGLTTGPKECPVHVGGIPRVAARSSRANNSPKPQLGAVLLRWLPLQAPIWTSIVAFRAAESEDPVFEGLRACRVAARRLSATEGVVNRFVNRGSVTREPFRGPPDHAENRVEA